MLMIWIVLRATVFVDRGSARLLSFGGRRDEREMQVRFIHGGLMSAALSQVRVSERLSLSATDSKCTRHIGLLRGWFYGSMVVEAQRYSVIFSSSKSSSVVSSY